MSSNQYYYNIFRDGGDAAKGDVDYQSLDIKNYLKNAQHDITAKYSFKFEMGKRLAEIDGIIPDTCPVYADKTKHTPLIYEKGKISLPNNMNDSGTVYLELNKKLRPREYHVIVWEITNIRVKVDQIDEALDTIFAAYAVYDSDETKDKKGKKMEVVYSDRKNLTLRLSEEPPLSKELEARLDTTQLKKQWRALTALRENPMPHNLPLLKLFRQKKDVKWNAPLLSEPAISYILPELQNSEQDGIDKQQEAVRKALATPDFAIIQGPPGSGKTTVLLEIIMQAIMRGERVLMAASTHVAVDNILERLEKGNFIKENGVIPLRIGRDGDIAESVKKYQIERVVETERWRILNRMKTQTGKKNRTRAEDKYYNLMKKDLDTVHRCLENVIFTTANFVCGTTIGILQAPMIKQSSEVPEPLFDLVIIDEASKTTFTEFLVPAVYGRKFIISGDTMQLTPYTDEEALCRNIQNILPGRDKIQNLALFDAQHKKHRIVICSKDTIDTLQNWIHEKDALIRCRKVISKEDISSCKRGDNIHLILTLKEFLPRLAEIYQEEGGWKVLSEKNEHISDLEYESWEKEVVWRLRRMWELKDVNDAYKQDLKTLCGSDDTYSKVMRWANVACTSILDILLTGYPLNNLSEKKNPKDYILYSGLGYGMPGSEILTSRTTLLTHQRRMHSSIADFSSKNIYNGEALMTPENLDAQRPFPLSPDQRVMWIDVKGGKGKEKQGVNNEEAKKIMKELATFLTWAENHPKDNSEPWSVAILSFYKHQVNELMKEFTKIKKHHHLTGSSDYYKLHGVEIMFGTVDRFQGKEADVVYLSFVRNHGVGFIDNRNRLNVAMTRAKYMLYLVGNRDNFHSSKSPELLQKLVESVPSKKADIHYKEGRRE